jgi:hypothetical protein
MANRIYQVLLTYLTRLQSWKTASIFLSFTVLSINCFAAFVKSKSQGQHLENIGTDVLFLQVGASFFPMLIFAHLITQFSQVGARLIPRFEFPHFIVAGLLWSAYVLILVFAMWFKGCEILGSFALATFIPSIITTVTEIQSARDNLGDGVFGGLKRLVQIANSGFMFAILWMFVAMQSTVESLLGQLARGEQPLIATLLALWGLLFPGLLIRRYCRLSGQMQADSTGFSPLESGMDRKWDWQEVPGSQTAIIDHSRTQEARSKRLETALALPGPRSAFRLSTSVNPYSGVQGALMAVCCCLIAFLVFSGAEFFPIQMRAPLITGKELFPIIVWCLFHFLGLSIATAWSEHCPVLRMEMLRPISRQQLIRQTFVNVAIDLAPIWFCQFILIFASLYLWPQQCQIPGWLLAVTVCFVSSAIFIYALVQYSILYGNSPYLAFVLIFTILNLIGAGFFLFPEKPSVLGLLFPQICWLIGALLFLYVMWCHWQTAEFD